MNISQKGSLPIFIAISLVVVGIAASGFFVIKNKNLAEDKLNGSIVETINDTVANGTPTNAVKAAAEQITNEVVAEDSAMKIEEGASEFSDTFIDELEGVADESNL